MVVMEVNVIQAAWGQLLRLAERYSGSPSTTVQIAPVTNLTTCRLLSWHFSNDCWFVGESIRSEAYLILIVETILSQVGYINQPDNMPAAGLTLL